MTTHYAFNGNDPERHRGFLRGLRELPGTPFFTYYLLDIHASRPRARIGWDTFIDNLVIDSDTIVDIDPDAGIRVDVSAARAPQEPAIVWRLSYDLPWSDAAAARVRGLMLEHYACQ